MATVQELLSRKPIEEIFDIAPDEPISAAGALMCNHRIGALLVRTAGGPIAGIISERDIVRAVSERAAEIDTLTVNDLLTADVETCSYKDTLVDVAKRMRRGGFRHMPVTDDTGLVGLISVMDIFRYYVDHEPGQQANVMSAYYMT